MILVYMAVARRGTLNSVQTEYNSDRPILGSVRLVLKSRAMQLSQYMALGSMCSPNWSLSSYFSSRERT